MSFLKEVLLIFVKSSAIFAILALLIGLAVFAVKTVIIHLPVWACFIAFPAIAGAFVTLTALLMAVLDFD